MKKNSVFSHMMEFFNELTGKNRFEMEDFVLLKTALMLAAVDGEVAEDEVARFREFAAKCRGYSGKSFDDLWENALRSAGYLLLQARFLDQDELVALFVREAEADFVGTVAQETSGGRTRAFNLLERMAQADGEYSEVERACIKGLTQAVKAAREKAIAARYPRAAQFGG